MPMAAQSPIDASAMFEPLTIRQLTVGNRFVMPAMQRSWCDEGRPTDLLSDYYCRRVAGGVGLIITEACAVDHPTDRRPQLGQHVALRPAAGRSGLYQG
jgi:2,4-dienoyl-CoA reductase-like NADH-dependent reductase (Old Yellow Enzyme family)